MAGSAFGRLARKYGALIFFPTFTVITIYADWSHTRAWKRQQLQFARSQELLKE
ncbi:uncharacterized protein LOC119639559 [Glossina fuscipes]|uniref:Uncharacterized protein LOC119639559 n=1 Tax=Glossina fuscipes TaxID=7396 RepID=A0A9C5ZAL6_9MUSC|nr:uncharacterized protein LOC119639559 [Glossina fuscipes]XP_037892944.1 uncharacterized protein LOC119639559 [Glossina fuscipes]XP_037892954.1 uncharacterized protein LOC119639559 [Glossina fuscipes]XP_037892962.1 uncharacterized protein LOC119639559 [Glossina fuscipes]XP_037892971.1 uncharacterized protein LOC119639559 [Glossina fuscipes]